MSYLTIARLILMTKSKDKFVIFNEWLDTCPFGDYITNKLDYDPKTKYWEFRVKVPGISKQLRDYYTDTNAQFYTTGG
jgi:hypothetical protein